MAIYGDEKHNENMEYNSPKFQITDKTVYRSTVWTIEGDNDTYHVTCQESDTHDSWHIVGDMAGEIDNDTELGYELISMCEFDDTVDV